MIEYVAGYSDTSVPVLYKQLTENGEVLMKAAITPSNLEELVNVEDAVIYDHINNLVEYIKKLSADLYIIPSGSNPRDGWPIIGWGDMAKVNALTSDWWNYVEFRDLETPYIGL